MPTIYVKVKPASRSRSVEETKDMFGRTVYQVQVTTSPENGEANKEVIIELAKYFKVPESTVKIKSGEDSGTKVITF